MESRESARQNNIGFLRLVFALMVVLTHAIVQVDGNDYREPIQALTRTCGAGSLAVDGFFLISGYLITQSWERSTSAWTYLRKRALRIYPGFIVAFWVSVLIVGPLGGGRLDLGVLKQVIHMAFLDMPTSDGAFVGLPFPNLNGSMWTIAYEFRCYLMVMALGTLGLLRRRRLILAATVGLLGLAALQIQFVIPWTAVMLVGEPLRTVRVTTMFAVGACYYLFRDRVRWDWRVALAAGAVLAGGLFTPLWETAAAVAGGYLTLWFGLHVRSPLGRINNRTDISYGTYLYAWPATSLLVVLAHWTDRWALVGATALIAMALGWVSWTLIEKPALDLKPSGSRLAPA